MLNQKAFLLSVSLLLTAATTCLAVTPVANPPQSNALQVQSADQFTPSEFRSLIRTLTPPIYQIMNSPAPTMRLVTAEPLLVFTPGSAEPALLRQGEILRPGIYWNISETSAILSIGDSDAIHEIPSLAVLSFDAVAQREPSFVSSSWEDTFRLSCTVTCDTGYYSCCICGPSGAICSCKQNGSEFPCSSGGPASSTCHIQCAQP